MVIVHSNCQSHSFATLCDRCVQTPEGLCLQQVKHLSGRYVESTQPMDSIGCWRRHRSTRKNQDSNVQDAGI